MPIVSRSKAALGAFAILAMVSPACAASPAVVGKWLNPDRTVAVETRMCGEALCGRVSWASPEALRDAADSGVPTLIGTELLQDYVPGRSGVWHGRVYVPDMRHTFDSTLVPAKGGQLRITGCILGGLICKSQLWHHE